MTSGGELDKWAVILASVCMVVAVLVSSLTVAAHVVQTRRQQLRNYTIRILIMVPIYASTSLLAILVKDWAMLLGVLRSTYEAFALFSFVQLMLAYLSLHAPADGDGARGAAWLALDLRTDPPTRHLWPVRCVLADWPMGPVFLRRTLVGVFQYSAFMPLITVASWLTWSAGVYGEDKPFSPARAFLYLNLLQNCSQMWALYCLVLFYQATASRLKLIRPLGKFLCIKLVVFFTWWQDVGIALMVEWGIIDASKLENPDANGFLSTDEVAVALNGLIVCVEMVVFALAHVRTFPPSDYAVEHTSTTKYSLQQPDGGAGDTLGDQLLGDLDDPEANPWDDRVRLPRARARDTLRDFARGVNVFDVLVDIRAMYALRTVDNDSTPVPAGGEWGWAPGSPGSPARRPPAGGGSDGGGKGGGRDVGDEGGDVGTYVSPTPAPRGGARAPAPSENSLSSPFFFDGANQPRAPYLEVSVSDEPDIF